MVACRAAGDGQAAERAAQSALHTKPRASWQPPSSSALLPEQAKLALAAPLAAPPFLLLPASASGLPGSAVECSAATKRPLPVASSKPCRLERTERQLSPSLFSSFFSFTTFSGAFELCKSYGMTFSSRRRWKSEANMASLSMHMAWKPVRLSLFTVENQEAG